MKRQRKHSTKGKVKRNRVVPPLALLDPATGRVTYSATWQCTECGARPFKGEVLHARGCSVDASSVRLHRAIDAILYECGIARVDIQRVTLHSERVVVRAKRRQRTPKR